MARLDLHEGLVIVTLSRRNLLAMIHKLTWADSARTITPGDCFRDGVPVDDVLLVLRAEDDRERYARRPEPPGPMHPYTEASIAEHVVSPDQPTG